MAEQKHIVHGDWRDQKEAILAVDPEFYSSPEEERKKLWSFVENVLKNYAPLKAQCSNCRKVSNIRLMYKCADCNSYLCEVCIWPHFGPEHKRHR